MIINASAISALTQGFNTKFNEAFAATESHVETLASIIKSSSKEDNYSWIGSMPTMREWIGQRVVANPEAFVYAIKNRTFESTVSVKREDIEDDSFGVYSPLFQQLGSLAKTHPDELIFALINGGFAAKCYDGQYFFDTDHAVAGKTVSNMLPANSVSLVWRMFQTPRLLSFKRIARRHSFDDNSSKMNEVFYYFT